MRVIVRNPSNYDIESVILMYFSDTCHSPTFLQVSFTSVSSHDRPCTTQHHQLLLSQQYLTRIISYRTTHLKWNITLQLKKSSIGTISKTPFFPSRSEVAIGWPLQRTRMKYSFFEALYSSKTTSEPLVRQEQSRQEGKHVEHRLTFQAIPSLRSAKFQAEVRWTHHAQRCVRISGRWTRLSWTPVAL